MTAHCDLCGDPAPQDEGTRAAEDASGLTICTRCLEDMLSETTVHARTALGGHHAR